MGQVNSKLRKTQNGYIHWCPACKQMHQLLDSWWFNGNLESPTFTPSFKHSELQTIRDELGKWTGEWVLDSNGNPIPEICHYILTNGILNYCGDCTHSMSNQSIPLPDLPKEYQDEKT